MGTIFTFIYIFISSFLLVFTLFVALKNGAELDELKKQLKDKNSL